MKPVISLDRPDPLAVQVAARLLAGRTGKPVDLGDTRALVPTAGAGRAIRRELARQGVFSPDDWNRPCIDHPYRYLPSLS